VLRWRLEVCAPCWGASFGAKTTASWLGFAVDRSQSFAMPERTSAAPEIDRQILVLRGACVMLDSDLAELYGVSTKALLQAVRRNPDRFPVDFIFPVSSQELKRLRSQSVTSKVEGRGGRRHQSFAFSEQGVAMLSSVLRSVTAVRVNIEIMRAFVRLRRAGIASNQLMSLVEELSKRVDTHDSVISDIVESIRHLAAPPAQGKRRPIGFTADISAEAKARKK
jgi:hypothetical protein